jgi:hypothetical protein
MFDMLSITSRPSIIRRDYMQFTLSHNMHKIIVVNYLENNYSNSFGDVHADMYVTLIAKWSHKDIF